MNLIRSNYSFCNSSTICHFERNEKKNRKVRFRDTPDEAGNREKVGQEFLTAGVNLLNTDHLRDLNEF
jgi:hypothetical protein